MKKAKPINNVVMVTNEFEKPIYIAPLKNLQIQITENKLEAEKWSEEFDQSKLKYYRTATGYDLKFENVATTTLPKPMV
jgi:hypothetical protein